MRLKVDRNVSGVPQSRGNVSPHSVSIPLLCLISHSQPALHRRAREATFEPRLHMRKAVEADELTRFVKADQVAHPAEQRNIGDGVVGADDPFATGEPLVKDAQPGRWDGPVAFSISCVCGS